MAGYRTHLTFSSLGGIALGGVSYFAANAPLSLCVLSGCLCSFGGILPDIDSKNSTAFQRVLSLVSGFVSLMLVSRLRDFPVTPEIVVVIGGGAFLFTWTVVGTIVQKFTRHRGMCHSIPMALIAAEYIYILSSGDTSERIFKGFSIFLGVMIHLTLDECYSIQVTGQKGKVYIKKSFGTALKMLDFDNIKATVCCFVILAFMTDAAINEPVWSEALEKDQVAEKQGKAAIDHLKATYPTQFDLSVIEWVAENKMILEPGSPDNDKWKELQSLFDKKNTTQNSSSSPQDSNAATDSDATSSPPQEKKLSFLEQINWSNRNRSNTIPTSLKPLFRYFK